MSAQTGTFTDNGTIALGRVGPSKAPGSFNTLFGKGDFGSGTLKIQVAPDKNGTTNAVDLVDAELTADGAVNFQARGEEFFVTLAGASGPDLTWWVL